MDDPITDQHLYLNGYPDTYIHAIGYAYAVRDGHEHGYRHLDRNLLPHAHADGPVDHCPDPHCNRRHSLPAGGDVLYGAGYGERGAPLVELLIVGLALFLVGVWIGCWLRW